MKHDSDTQQIIGSIRQAILEKNGKSSASSKEQGGKDVYELADCVLDAGSHSDSESLVLEPLLREILSEVRSIKQGAGSAHSPSSFESWIKNFITESMDKWLKAKLPEIVRSVRESIKQDERKA